MRHLTVNREQAYALVSALQQMLETATPDKHTAYAAFTIEWREQDAPTPPDIDPRRAVGLDIQITPQPYPVKLEGT